MTVLGAPLGRMPIWKTLVANVRSGSGYQNRKWGTEREVADYYESYDFPVIRYAEVLLNYAEAVYELNGEISDSGVGLFIDLVFARESEYA